MKLVMLPLKKMSRCAAVVGEKPVLVTEMEAAAVFDSAAAATPVTACAVARGALLCAAADLGPGYHVALLECAALPPAAMESAHVL